MYIFLDKRKYVWKWIVCDAWDGRVRVKEKRWKKVNKIVCEAIDNIKLTLYIPYVMKIDRLQQKSEWDVKPWIKLNYNPPTNKYLYMNTDRVDRCEMRNVMDIS